MNAIREGLIRKAVHRQLESRYAKVCLFDALLNEAEGDEPLVGEEFEKAEAEAKEKYTAAQEALRLWDENKAKKDAFDAEYAKLRASGMGEDRARKQLRGDERYAYNVPLSAKKRATLEAEHERAEARYAAYNPEVRGYRRERRKSTLATTDKKLPPKRKKIVLDIAKIPFMTWLKWPSAVRRTNISYGSKAAGSDNEQIVRGTGPGEEWLAYVLGGQLQGGGVSYDLVLHDGSTWEVKQLLRQSDTIRPGVEGRKAFERARTWLLRIMNQLRAFTKAAKVAKLRDHLNEDDVKRLDFIESFVTDEFEMIGKGEISKERFVDLRSTLNTVNKLRREMGVSDRPASMTVGLNDKEVSVDKPTFIDVAKRVEKATKRDDILSDIEEVDIVLSTLKDPAFDDPKAFFDEWFKSVKATNVFSQVDGLIIVNPQGFMVVPQDQLGSALRFDKVSQGFPKFILSNYGSGPK